MPLYNKIIQFLQEVVEKDLFGTDVDQGKVVMFNFLIRILADWVFDSQVHINQNV